MGRSSIVSSKFEGAARASRIWVVRGSGRAGYCRRVKADVTGLSDIVISANRGSRGTGEGQVGSGRAEVER